MRVKLRGGWVRKLLTRFSKLLAACCLFLYILLIVDSNLLSDPSNHDNSNLANTPGDGTPSLFSVWVHRSRHIYSQDSASSQQEDSPPSPQQQRNMTRSLPDVIIFGIRKCGTRALLSFLSRHPRVSAADHELHFFDRYYDQGLEWYRSRMPLIPVEESGQSGQNSGPSGQSSGPSGQRDSASLVSETSPDGEFNKPRSYPAYTQSDHILRSRTPRMLTIEKTPAYFITPEAPQRVRSMNPDIKLILIIRDPVTRAISDYTQLWHNRDSRNESTEPFDVLALDSYTQSVNLFFKPLWVSVYHHHVQLWLQHFNRSQIHIVDGEKLVSHPSAELTKVEEFLGLEHFLTEDKFYYNSTKGFYCMRVASVDRCLGDAKGRNHPQISQKVLRKLKQFYKPHNALLFKLINRTFEWK